MIAPLLTLVLSLAPQGGSSAPHTGAFTYGQARHLLVRAGFSGTPEEVSRLQAMGLEGAVAHLVDYEAIPDELPPHGIVPTPWVDRAKLAGMTPEERRMAQQLVRRQDQRSFQVLRGWWIERMLRSSRPLEEKMTLFWHGLFTSEYATVRNAYHMALQNDLFRSLATDNFATMLGEVSRDPAMLRYLDNYRSNRRAPNENYARELLELFTLGEGNYTEQDIREAARAFTGWTFEQGTGQFRFAARNHDYGQKQFLGQTGNFNGDDIHRIILEQEAASRHLARKLLTFFAKEKELTDAEVEPYARILVETNFEIKPVLRTLFSSQWFYSDDHLLAEQVKSPVMYVVSLLREMGVAEAPGRQLAARCEAIGQSLMNPPNVKGWEGGNDWIASSTLLERYNVSREIIAAMSRPGRPGNDGGGREAGQGGRRGRRPPLAVDATPSAGEFSLYRLVTEAGLTEPREIVAMLEHRFLAKPLAAPRRQMLIDFLGTEAPVLDLRSRRAAERKLMECLHLLTTTREFQTC